MHSLSNQFASRFNCSQVLCIAALLATLQFVTGCGGFGTAKVTGHLSGRAINVGGTVYAYTDSIQRRPGSEGSNKRIVLVMSGAQFDPSVDYSHPQHKEGLGAISQVFSKNDLFLIVFNEANNLKSGTRFSPRKLDHEVLFGGQSASTAPKLGKQRSLDVALTSVELFGKSGRVKGVFDLYISKSADEDSSVLTGHLRGEFDAPVMDAAIARTNMKLYGSSWPALVQHNLFSEQTASP
jgi:hypothetical protein